VCGLLTDGLKLADKKYLEMLLQTGLDHVLLILQPQVTQSWQAIETILPEDLFLTVHLTLTTATVKDAEATLKKLADLGVKSLSLSIADPALAERLSALQNTAGELGFTLRWDLPVPYSASNPAAFESEDDKIASGAGKVWMYVEPDGDVLPAQGSAGSVLGNLLRDPWDKIHL